MYSGERLFETLTYEELYCTLRVIAHEDCYLSEWIETSIMEDFLFTMEHYEIVFVASDDRVLLTQRGEKILQYISQKVDLDKF